MSTPPKTPPTTDALPDLTPLPGKQTGAEVVTYRSGFPLELIDKLQPSLILVSPGPGRPADFGVPELVRYAAYGQINTMALAIVMAVGLVAFVLAAWGYTPRPNR